MKGETLYLEAKVGEPQVKGTCLECDSTSKRVWEPGNEHELQAKLHKDLLQGSLYQGSSKQGRTHSQSYEETL